MGFTVKKPRGSDLFGPIGACWAKHCDVLSPRYLGSSKKAPVQRAPLNFTLELRLNLLIFARCSLDFH